MSTDAPRPSASGYAAGVPSPSMLQMQARSRGGKSTTKCDMCMDSCLSHAAVSLYQVHLPFQMNTMFWWCWLLVVPPRFACVRFIRSLVHSCTQEVRSSSQKHRFPRETNECLDIREQRKRLFTAALMCKPYARTPTISVKTHETRGPTSRPGSESGVAAMPPSLVAFFAEPENSGHVARVSFIYPECQNSVCAQEIARLSRGFG